MIFTRIISNFIFYSNKLIENVDVKTSFFLKIMTFELKSFKHLVNIEFFTSNYKEQLFLQTY